MNATRELTSNMSRWFGAEECSGKVERRQKMRISKNLAVWEDGGPIHGNMEVRRRSL